jgi:DNA-binding PadR family transcriptional regulator
MTRQQDELDDFGRFAEPALMILISLADGPKHGYAMTDDIEEVSGVRFGPGTLYGAITRLEQRGLIEPLAADDRRRPYCLTAAGTAALEEGLAGLRRLVDVGTTRLQAAT